MAIFVPEVLVRSDLLAVEALCEADFSVCAAAQNCKNRFADRKRIELVGVLNARPHSLRHNIAHGGEVNERHVFAPLAAERID